MENNKTLSARLKQIAPRLGTPAWILTLVGIAAVYGGWRWTTLWLFSSGIVLVGIGMALLGIETLYAPELPERQPSDDETDKKHNFGNIVWGSWFVFIGVAIVLFGLAFLLGLGDSMLSFFQERPGIPIIITALSLVAYGLPSVFGVRRRVTSLLDLTTRMPGLVLAATALVLGLVAFALGIFEIISPSGFDSLLGL
ncbi:MAG: hypothetical protein DWQ07_16745 [Chloroflexi bacterium]|nr:MAG: hypothetical protein DWQ07_16745 [Chloroflexota bacterium]MBL1195396.1 hypothetical protein [Chloroflexota bacterium]NOH12679.1 hypothetical protein [Chloroflexota bacterium]